MLYEESNSRMKYHQDVPFPFLCIYFSLLYSIDGLVSHCLLFAYSLTITHLFLHVHDEFFFFGVLFQKHHIILPMNENISDIIRSLKELYSVILCINNIWITIAISHPQFSMKNWNCIVTRYPSFTVIEGWNRR